MKKFRDLKIRSKLIVVFFVVLLPLVIAEVLTIWSFSDSLKSAAELELKNIVNHLYHMSSIQERYSNGNGRGLQQGLSDGAKSSPDKSDIAYLKELMDGFKIGHTGYPYVMNSKGVLIIHPARAGDDISGMKDSKGFRFIEEICSNAVRLAPTEIGTIRYPWKNDEEGVFEPRMKILKYRYFEKWDWIIAVGSYEEEIYEQLVKVEASTTGILILSIVLGIILIAITSSLIVRPLISLSKASEKMSSGNLSQRVNVKSKGDEISRLASNFNLMADQIRGKTEDLEKMVNERTVELKESRETYRSLVEGTVDGIVTTDMSGTVTFVNTGMETILRQRRDDVLGRKIFSYYTKGIEQAREIMGILKNYGSVANYEIELLTHDERVIPIRTSNTLLFDVHGQMRGTLGIFTDITQEKKLQKELIETQAHLAQSMKMRALGDLVAGVAHEVNNPLMAASTMLHVLSKNEIFNEERNKKKIVLVQSCHERIAKIVNHLREFSREAAMELAVININTPLENSLMIMGQQLLNMGITIDRQLSEDLPLLNGDPNYLEQVFINLIGNARDVLETVDGEKVLTVKSFSCEFRDAPAIGVAISDTGPGIPDNVKDKIFEPFFTTKEVGKGTGLGLSICFGIIEGHHGTMEVETEIGQGTTFIIMIPAIEQNIKPD